MSFKSGDLVTLTNAIMDTAYGRQLRITLRQFNIADNFDTPVYKIASTNGPSVKILGGDASYLSTYFEKVDVEDKAKEDFSILPSNPDILQSVTQQKYYVIADNKLVHVLSERAPAITAAEKLVERGLTVAVIVGADLASTKTVTVSKLVLH